MDSGANRSTFTETTIQDNSHLVTHELRKGEPTLHFIYGNDDIQFSSDRAILLGKFKVQLVPSEHCINLLSVRDIVIKGGHVVLFTPTSAIMKDIGENCKVRFEKLISEDDWFAPNKTLNKLSGLRDKHPLTDEALYMSKHGQVDFETIKINIDDPASTLRPQRRLLRILSGRLRTVHPTIRGRVFHIHHIMGHMCEDCMYRAVTPRRPGVLPHWRNIGVTGTKINHVFRHEPCLLCILAMRRGEGMRKLLTKVQKHPESKLKSNLNPMMSLKRIIASNSKRMLC